MLHLLGFCRYVNVGVNMCSVGLGKCIICSDIGFNNHNKWFIVLGNMSGCTSGHRSVCDYEIFTTTYSY